MIIICGNTKLVCHKRFRFLQINDTYSILWWNYHPNNTWPLEVADRNLTSSTYPQTTTNKRPMPPMTSHQHGFGQNRSSTVQASCQSWIGKTSMKPSPAAEAATAPVILQIPQPMQRAPTPTKFNGHGPPDFNKHAADATCNVVITTRIGQNKSSTVQWVTISTNKLFK